MDMQSDENQEPSEATDGMPEARPAEESQESIPSPEGMSKPRAEGEAPVGVQSEAADIEASRVEAPEPEAEAAPVDREDALAEMRRSLREEEQAEPTGFRAKFQRLMQRVFRRKKPAVEDYTVEQSRLDELKFPEPPSPAKIITPSEPGEGAPTAPPEAAEPRPTKPRPESKAEFEALVRNKLSGALAHQEEREPLTVEPSEPTPEPEEEYFPAVGGHSILTTLRQEETEPAAEEPTSMRDALLEDYSTAPEEPEPEPGTPVVRNLRRSWRYMRPADRRLLIVALVVIGLAALAGSGYLAVKSLPAPTPVVTPTTSTLPFPISVSLPGGWVFPLRTGYVQQDGSWNPSGAEWLSGTEVCRWVSLPWTVQLEAVLRTLKADDPIQLSMSNYDGITYKVKSIEQVPSGDLQKLAADTPCLLLVLSKEKTDSRWVVTAKP